MARRASRPVQLTRSEAACLDAVRGGVVTKTKVALRAQLDLNQADAALHRIASAGLIEKHERRWGLTRRGHTAAVSVKPDPERRRGGQRRGEVRPGTSSHRLLSLLARPRRGAEIIAELGVSPQRVHQLVVRLAAAGLVRVGDPDRPLYAVALSDDRSVLLRAWEEAVLSVLPATEGTTLAKIGQAARQTAQEVRPVIRSLVERGLAQVVGPSRRGELYRLTATGPQHWQRRPATRTAEPPALPVRSDRVKLVLAHLAEHGPARTHSVGLALGIPRRSMNALMQYLKRKELVRKAGADLHAPHELTSEGEETLRAMLR